MLEDRRGQVNGAQQGVQVVVGLMVGGLMSAFLIPMVINEILSVDTSSWTGGAGELWGLLPVMIVLAIFIMFVGLALERSGNLQ